MDDHTSRPVWPRWVALSLGSLLVALCLSPVRALVASELRETPIVKAVQRARSAVVNIRGEKTITATAASTSQTPGVEAGRRVNGMGTGVIIDPRGYILTNHHVVDGVQQITVTRANGERHVAQLVARDAETDLAVIKIDTKESLQVIPIATSSDLMPGETVIALGNAYGYEHTVTRGIISALHRAVQVSDAQYYDDLIQTDASINPGNSGGPLLNIDGDMIGINVAVRAGAQGIGFAIPADKATGVAAVLLASCGANRGWLGVVSAKEPVSTKPGMTIGEVEQKSPAADAGLASGDTIVQVDDVDIQRPLDFQRAMLERKAGEKFQVTVRRASELRTVNVKLADPPEAVKSAEQPLWENLGLELQAIAPNVFRKTHQTRYRGGLNVAAVRPNSPAANQGIQAGDILVGIHIWETVSMENVAYVLKRPDLSSGPVKFFILRDGDTLFGYLPVEPTKTAQR